MNELLFQSSIDEIISKRAIPTEMLRDLHNIANLSEASCQSVAHAVDALDGLTTAETIETAIRDALGGGRSPVVSSINAVLVTLKQDSVKPLVSSVTDWVNASDARKKVFSIESLQHLARNLGILLTDHSAIRLLQKANQLLRDVGNEIETVKYVCDLRPVFDAGKEHVDAFVLIANLRLVYLSQDGQRQSCEIALTEDELESLHEKTSEAIEKMSVLNNVRKTVSIGLAGNEGVE